MKKIINNRIEKQVLVKKKNIDFLLNKGYSVKDIENSLIKIFIMENKLKTKNKLLLSIIKKDSNKITKDLKNYLNRKNIKLNFKIIENFFELLIKPKDKKENGTFYTPKLVTDYIINQTIKGDEKVCDLSCGCGAFLIGALKRIHKLTNKSLIHIIENNIFGADISKDAIRRAKIIISLFVIFNGEDKPLIRFNLINTDSLLLNWEKTFKNVFKKGGFDSVVGNPPYAPLRPKYNLTQLSKSYDIIEKNSKTNIYLLFLELMFKILKKNGHGGVIVPLSIAFNTGKPFIKLRKMIENLIGEWKFSFYDRSPDSLFGDEVKTRNCIILFNKKKIKKAIYTTKLIRWNSKIRDKLFNNIKYKSIKNLPISKAIPKISTSLELETIKKFKTFDRLYKDIEIKKQSKIRGANLYFYNTAYNWISVFTHTPFSYNGRKKTVPSSLLKILCKNKSEQKILYAILSSNLIFWYWVVFGDSFHVTHNFIKNIPISISILSKSTKNRLIYLSNQLSKEIIKHPISKINKNISIKNYNLLMCNNILTKIDETLIKELDIDNKMLNFLSNFKKEHISAGRDIFKNKEYVGILKRQ